ncbi:hypothetical protein [Rhodobacter lacus]|uniref:Uncharacterized protein n=1 Tax=Rhodobacter lacus TaxID=1641972 RepID=A0ABW5A6H7_9RHOB
MADRLELLQARLAELEAQVEEAWEQSRAQWRYRFTQGRIEFDQGVRDAHRLARVRLWQFLRRTRPMVVLTAPFIYAVFIPFVLLDLFVSLYQAICFPVYGIPKVKRREHVVIDRQMLAYLNLVQKINCVYCGYGNGVISYVREVAARTEQYWCPIKHARRVKGVHPYYGNFCDFGDAEGFREQTPKLRRALRELDRDE